MTMPPRALRRVHALRDVASRHIDDHDLTPAEAVTGLANALGLTLARAGDPDMLVRVLEHLPHYVEGYTAELQQLVADGHATQTDSFHPNTRVPPFRYRWDLTPHERAALMTVLGEHIARPDATEVSIDAITGEELEISAILRRVIDLPTLTEAVPHDHVFAQYEVCSICGKTEAAIAGCHHCGETYNPVCGWCLRPGGQPSEPEET